MLRSFSSPNVGCLSRGLRRTPVCDAIRHGRRLPPAARLQPRFPQTRPPVAAQIHPELSRAFASGPMLRAADSSPYSSSNAQKESWRRPMTVQGLHRKARRGHKLVMVTAYDYPTGCWCDEAGVDIVLVGDSLGNVVLGEESTTVVTMDMMVHHCRATSKGAQHPLLVGDMPFASYLTETDALRNAARLVQEGGAQAVKLEGGVAQAAKVAAITREGIPVVGHIGLAPQTAGANAGFAVVGKSAAGAQQCVADALALQDAGAAAVVLELVPDELGAAVAAALEVPVIGIGAGPHTTGQVLVLHDLLGMSPGGSGPRFSTRMAHLQRDAVAALEAYADNVREGSFPGEAQNFPMPPKAAARFADIWADTQGFGTDTPLPPALAARQSPDTAPTAKQQRSSSEQRLPLCWTHLAGRVLAATPPAPGSHPHGLDIRVVGGGSLGRWLFHSLAAASGVEDVASLALVRSASSAGADLLTIASTPAAGADSKEPVQLRALSDPAGLHLGDRQVVLVCTKDTPSAQRADEAGDPTGVVGTVAALLDASAAGARSGGSSGRPVVVCFSNGVGQAERLQAAVGDRADVLAGVVTYGVTRSDPADDTLGFSLNGLGSVLVGPVDGQFRELLGLAGSGTSAEGASGGADAAAQAVVRLLTGAGLDASALTSRQMAASRAKKLVVNAGINMVTAQFPACRVNGHVLDEAWWPSALRWAVPTALALCRVGVLSAAELGVASIESDDKAELRAAVEEWAEKGCLPIGVRASDVTEEEAAAVVLALTSPGGLIDVATRTESNVCSTRQDLEAGRETEVRALRLAVEAALQRIEP